MTDPITQESLDVWLHTFSPRTRFLKTLPVGSRVLDLGAGEGSLAIFKAWIAPARPDLRMFGVSLGPGTHQHLYEAWTSSNFETTDPFPGETFDAVFAAHFAEHIEGGAQRVLAWIATKLRPLGLAYVEMPSSMSLRGPRRNRLRAEGYPVSTTSFHDDRTHRETVGLDELREAMRSNGLFVEESGYWRNPYLEPELLRRARGTEDTFRATAAVWMATRFAQYAIGTRDRVDFPSWTVPDLHRFAD